MHLIALFCFGLMLIAGGIHVFMEDSSEWFISGIVVACGLWLWSWIIDSFRASPGIDVAVKNKIVAHDGQGRYLVRAKTSHNIIGPRRHVTGNLPAGIYKTGDDLFIVDATGGAEPNYKDINWKPVDGNYHIEPRGNAKTKGFLADVVEGYSHDYIVRDE